LYVLDLFFSLFVLSNLADELFLSRSDHGEKGSKAIIEEYELFHRNTRQLKA